MTESNPTLPTKTNSAEFTRFNALRHGVLSRYTVLPWEDVDEYDALIAALAAEHAPQGPTEEHLVEEIAGILWRKRRLRLAEAAAHRHGLEETFSPHRKTKQAALAHLRGSDPLEDVSCAVRATATDTEEEMADITAEEARTRGALGLLDTMQNDAYEAALAALSGEAQKYWADMLAREFNALKEREEPIAADATALRRFIENTVLPWIENRKKELANRPLIREQAFGEALDPERLEKLGRYEVHLDRKLERMLTMLLRLKDLRQGVAAG